MPRKIRLSRPTIDDLFGRGDGDEGYALVHDVGARDYELSFMNAHLNNKCYVTLAA